MGTAFEEMDNLFFCINQYYYMLIFSWYLDISFLQIKSQIGFKIDGLMWAYPCGYALFE